MAFTIADWVAIGVIALFCLFGLIVGFGRGLRFFTKGFFGFIISIIFCYCLGGIIIRFEVIQNLLGMLTGALEGKGGICDFLLAIHIETIVYYVALFIVVTIIRIIIVHIVSGVFEIENVFIIFINKIFGLIFFVAVLALLTMFVFNILYIIGGSVSESVLNVLQGSALKLDWFYLNNPLMEMIELLFKIEIRIPVAA